MCILSELVAASIICSVVIRIRAEEIFFRVGQRVLFVFVVFMALEFLYT